MTRPACAVAGLDPTVEQNERTTYADVIEIREAVAHLCRTCPILDACRSKAEDDRLDPDETCKPFGIWGGRFYDGTRAAPKDPIGDLRLRQMATVGSTDGEIAVKLGMTLGQVRHARIRLGIPGKGRGSGPEMSPEFEHGVSGGLRKHLRRGQEPCDACMEAERADNRRRSRARLARKRAAA